MKGNDCKKPWNVAEEVLKDYERIPKFDEDLGEEKCDWQD